MPQTLPALLEPLSTQFNILANAWLASGASAFSVWADGAPLISWPAKTDLETDFVIVEISMNSN